MAKTRDKQNPPDEEQLDKFLNQPNINMTVPWIYDIYKTMVNPEQKSRDGESDDDSEMKKKLQLFLNQPNINMTIPWIYEIAKAVKSGGGGGGGGSSGSDLEWDDVTDRGGEINEIDEEEGD